MDEQIIWLIGAADGRSPDLIGTYPDGTLRVIVPAWSLSTVRLVLQAHLDRADHPRARTGA